MVANDYSSGFDLLVFLGRESLAAKPKEVLLEPLANVHLQIVKEELQIFALAYLAVIYFSGQPIALQPTHSQLVAEERVLRQELCYLL